MTASPPSGDGVSPSPASRDAVVIRYGYLCRRAARRYLRTGLDRRDLGQVAMLGLLKAIDRYDDSRGVPFESYASLVIAGELSHHVRDHEHVVRMPRRVVEGLTNLHASHERLRHRFEREPSDAELAAELGRPLRRVRELRIASAALAARTSTDANDAAGVDAVDAVDAVDRLLLADALAALPQRERRIVVGSYLVGLTSEEIAERLALSTRHVARLRRSALETMRTAFVRGLPA